MSTTQNLPLIAGQRAGKPIRCITKLEPVFQRLQQAARRNHYWATIAVKELNALTTGVLGKNNVYVRPGKSRTKNSNELYYVFLPGLKATVVRWPDDQFCITELNLDDNYFRATEWSDDATRMGLYRAREDRDRNAWNVELVPNGKIHKQPGRLIAVADARYKQASDAAADAVPRAVELLGVGAAHVSANGADLHFTPGQKALGGLVCYNPLAVDKARKSAVLLAKAMADARDIEDVTWIADSGGSAVLTQAMQILADKGITLEKHGVYLYKPRTSPARALRLAHQLKLRLNQRFADTGYSVHGALSQYSVAGLRLKNNKDPYNKGYHAKAWLNGAQKVAAPAGILAAAIGGQAGMAMAAIATAITGAGVLQDLAKGATERFGYKFRR
ncbi:hypothetical protein [Microbulbifer thermotolerans]|uniref:Uncharacterized protein n=1 Tax=Microbulbifer thermotolerans TaxID=252514 RepID=A0A143HPH2_MICTH|nr:hypothetical protein [Microbulbifer thermotolerans]AMX03397.1 hypothetical protein A3224_13125 [Microbulbifer thermotolerans]MCX2802744.1 hypothetical protein [Microbulbifer thermotolerans]